MAIADTSLYPQARQALAQSAPATAPQLAALKAELDADPTGRGYKNADGSFKALPALFELLNTPFGIPNPEAQGRIPLSTLTQGQVIVVMTTLQAKRAGAIEANVTLPPSLVYLVDTLMPNVAKQDSLDLTAPDSQAMFASIQASELMTPKEITALTTKPDPAYVAILPQDAPAKALCGIAEVADIVVALAS